MSRAIDNLNKALSRAAAIRPKVAGFPYLAESLRHAGVIRNIWSLPACQSLFLTSFGSVVMQGAPLVSGTVDVPTFDEEALIKALRIDQAGESTFSEFLAASWRAGGSLRRGFCCPDGNLPWLHRRGVHRSISGRRDQLIYSDGGSRRPAQVFAVSWRKRVFRPQPA